MRKLVVATGMGYDVPTLEQIDRLAKIGWDGVFTGWDEQGNENKQIAEKIKNNGMIYQSIHAPFNKVDKLWEEGEAGDTEMNRQIACLNAAAEVGVDLVVLHTIIGFDKFTPTALGIDRYGKIFEHAAKAGVTVALENTEGQEYLDALMDAYKHHSFVKFCIDTGHEMCYNYSRDLITKYGDRLVATHLNDNMGITTEKIYWHDDAHLLPFDGIADWNGIAKRLNAVGFSGPLTFELTSKNKPNRNTHDRYAHLDFDGFAALALEKAKAFRDIIEK